MTSLLASIESRNLEKVRRVVEESMDANVVNERDRNSNTPLMIAIRGNPEIVEYLLAREADPKAVSKDGNQALHYAIRDGRTRAAQILIEAGAPLNHANILGQTPLLCAMLYPQSKLDDLLLAKGASMDAAFRYAAAKNHIDHVTKLVEHHVDINSVDKEGCSGLMLAAREGHLDVVQYLIQRGADLNIAHNKTGQTALLFAIAMNRMDVLRALLDAGADLECATKKDRETALLYASRTSPLEMIELLVNKGADVKVLNKAGGSALMHAAARGLVSIAEILISKGCPLEAADDYGETALIFAIKLRMDSVITSLIAHGVDLNVHSRARGEMQGFSALMVAVTLLETGLARLLLESGRCAVNYVNKQGYSALGSAAAAGYFPLVHLLLQHGASPNSSAVRYFSHIYIFHYDTLYTVCIAHRGLKVR